jgi:hypothetical protein
LTARCFSAPFFWVKVKQTSLHRMKSACIKISADGGLISNALQTGQARIGWGGPDSNA